jgi:hypothetical protein
LPGCGVTPLHRFDRPLVDPSSRAATTSAPIRHAFVRDYMRAARHSTATRIHAKEKGTQFSLSAFGVGGPCKIRTYDQLIKSQLLYQLS